MEIWAGVNSLIGFWRCSWHELSDLALLSVVIMSFCGMG